MQETIQISVIVATRNRAASLKELLESLATQQTDAQAAYEVLVIDNGSTDDTRQTVEALQIGFPAPLRYHYEPRPGKPWALNAGMALAHGAILAFTDDDVVASPSWLSALHRCFLEERVDAVTGKILPCWLAPRPAWLTDRAFRSVATLGCVNHGSVRRRTLDGQDCRWVGGNLAIRREATVRVGDYDVRMARSQDMEYYHRCLAQGLLICYEPDAVVFHKVGPERMTPTYFRQWRRRTGYYNAAQMSWQARDLVTVMPLWWYRVSGRLAWRWLRAVVVRRTWLERFRWELLLQEQLGVLGYRIQMWPSRWRNVLPHTKASSDGR